MSLSQMNLYDFLRREIEISNYLTKMISVFPAGYITREQTIDVLRVLIFDEYGNGVYNLPSLSTRESQTLFCDMIRGINGNIKPHIIINKLQSIYSCYESLINMRGTAESIYMRPDETGFKIGSDFNMMNLCFKLPKIVVSKVQAVMGNSKWVTIVLLMYCIRFSLFSDINKFAFGVFPDLDKLAEQYAVRKKGRFLF